MRELRLWLGYKLASAAMHVLPGGDPLALNIATSIVAATTGIQTQALTGPGKKNAVSL